MTDKLSLKDRQDLLLATNVGSELVPIAEEEIPREETLAKEDEKFKQFQDEEFKREFYAMTARLFGTNGSGGDLDEIKTDLKKTLTNQADLKLEMQKMKAELQRNIDQETHSRQEEDARLHSCYKNLKRDVDNLGDIAREARDKSSTFWCKCRDAAIPLIVAGVIVLLVLGMLSFIQGNRLEHPLEQPVAIVGKVEKNWKWAPTKG